MLIRDNRFYEKNGEHFVRTSWVLGERNAPTLNTWRANLGASAADQIAKEAADDGTEIHNIIKDLLEGTVVDKLGRKNDVVRKVDSFLNLYNDHDLRPRYVEEAVYWKDGDRRVAGTPDFIGMVDGKMAIIDWKSGKSLHDNQELQVTFYGMAHMQMRKVKKWPDLYLAHLRATSRGKGYTLKKVKPDVEGFMALVHLFYRSNPDPKPVHYEVADTWELDVKERATA